MEPFYARFDTGYKRTDFPFNVRKSYLCAICEKAILKCRSCYNPESGIIRCECIETCRIIA